MPKPYHQAQPWNWFVKRPAYVRFMLRELTAVLVGAYLIFLLVFLNRLGHGQDAFVALLQYLQSPFSMILHALALVAALWHSITWFNLTPKAMPLFVGEKRLADPLLAFGMGYLPWIVVSIVVLWGMWP